MATQDKAMLLNQVEGTLRTRMFANLLEEAVDEINGHLDEYDIQHISNTQKSNDMLRAFIEAKRVEGRSEKTLVRYEYLIGKFLTFAGVGTRDITTSHVRAYLSAEQERGIADSTLEGIRQILCGFFGWLEHQKMIRINPMDGIGVIRCQKKVRESFTKVDIERLKRNCKSVRDMAIICVLLSTGCRISEIVGMNRSDIDFSRGECIVLGKGNKELTVYLDQIALMTLREYLATRTDDNDALFIQRYGERIQAGGVRVLLKKISEIENVSNVHPHRFRRTMITNLLNNGMQIQEVAIVAGHDKIDTTMAYFARDNERIKSSYQRYWR